MLKSVFFNLACAVLVVSIAGFVFRNYVLSNLSSIWALILAALYIGAVLEEKK